MLLIAALVLRYSGANRTENGKAAAALKNLPCDFATHCRSDRLLHVRHIHAVSRDGLPIHADDKLRHARHLIHLDVSCSRIRRVTLAISLPLAIRISRSSPKV